MLNRNSTSDLFGRALAFSLTACVLIGALPADAQNKRAEPRTGKSNRVSPPPKQPTTNSAEFVFPKPQNSVMGRTWQSGELPAPLPVPPGNADDVVAVLARKVTAKTDESVPALLTALQLAGFFVTDRNGQVSLAPTDGKGQGLTVNGWEVASMAKMLGDGRGVPLAELEDGLASVPMLSNLSKKNQKVGALLIEGIRANAANTNNPYLRAWAGFII